MEYQKCSLRESISHRGDFKFIGVDYIFRTVSTEGQKKGGKQIFMKHAYESIGRIREEKEGSRGRKSVSWKVLKDKARLKIMQH